MSERKSLAGRIGVLGAAALFSTGGAAIKLCSWGGWQVAGVRSLIAFLFLFAVLPSARRGWSWRIWMISSVYAATLIMFVSANKLTTAANTIFLQATAPLYLLLISPWLLKERIRRNDVIFMAALAIGMSCFFLGTEATTAIATHPKLGNALAVASGLGWALTIAGLRWTAKSAPGGPEAAATAGNLVAALVCIPFAWPLASGSVTDWGAVLFLGVAQIGLAYVLLTRAMRFTPAFEASLLLLLEPVLNPIWAWLMHGERPGPWAIAGSTVILAATAWHAWSQARRPKLP
jgi:drug/metabolite transporter (DMT)-like permease